MVARVCPRYVSRIVMFACAFCACMLFMPVSHAFSKDASVQSQEGAILAPLSMEGLAHVQNEGDVAGTSSDGILTLGTTGKSERLEAISVQVADDSGITLEYRSHIQNLGWEDAWTSARSGTTGQSLRLEAVQMRLSGADKDKYDLYYRTHVQDLGWMSWACQGEQSGSAGYGLRMEALQVAIVSSGAGAPAPLPANDMDSPYKSSRINTKTHVQDVGWQGPATEGELAGTEGRSLRMEAISITLDNQPYAGGVRYKGHVQNIGWQDWAYNGDIAGTSGQALRIEAMQIELYGDAANHFDVYYRVHAQNLGWLDWAKNGACAGTAGAAYRLEALQALLVGKGAPAPGSTAVPYVDSSSLALSFSAWSADGPEPRVSSGGQVGTTGMANPLTALSAMRTGGLPGSIWYETHLANVGWVPASSNGAVSGERDPAKSIQAIKLGLDGDASRFIDVYYRAHVANIGWMDWASNGMPAGSTGLGYPMEAFEVRLLVKGAAAPGPTASSFFDGQSVASIRAKLNITEMYYDGLFVHGDKGVEHHGYIMLHDTEGGGNAANIVEGWAGNGNLVATHFVVNRDGSIVQCVPVDKIAHHAGFAPAGSNARFGIWEDGRDDMRGTRGIGSYSPDYAMNAWSVGIEMVHYAGQDYPEAQLHAVDGLIALIDASFGKKAPIIQHSDWNGNSDCDAIFQGFLANYQASRTHHGGVYVP